MNSKIERAELIQSLKAFLIPSSLFVATLICSSGFFLIFKGYTLGWLFLCVGAVIITTALAAFARFQNKLRAAGQFRQDTACQSSITLNEDTRQTVTIGATDKPDLGHG